VQDAEPATVRNHTRVMGPNHRDTLSVPVLCTQKRTTRIRIVSGRT